MQTQNPPKGDAWQSTTASTHIAASRQLYWFAASIILILAGSIAWTLYYLRVQALESGTDLTESFAQVVEEQVTRTLQTVDFRLQIAESALAKLKAEGRLSPESSREMLQKQFEELPFVRVVYVIDAQGRVTSLSGPTSTNIGLDLSHREYFKAHLNQRQSGFYVGTPVRGSTSNAWTVTASRPLYSGSSEFAGIIVAALDSAYFDTHWRSVDVGEGGSIALFRRNGVLLLRSPLDDNAMGKQFATGPIFGQMVPNSPTGSLRTASAIDGLFRTFAYRTLSAQPELIVVVGQSVDLVLTPWRRLAALVVAVWSVFSAGIIAFCVFLGRAWRRQEQVEANALRMTQRLAMATDAASIGVWDWDINTADQWYATSTYFTALGYDAQEGFANRSQWIKRVHPDDRKAVENRIRAVLDGADVPYQYEARLRHADGSYRWTSVVGRVLERDASGKPMRLMGVRIDITAQKRAEEDRLQGLERITDAFVALDKNWCYTYVNKKAGQMFDREPSQLIGKHIWTEFPEGVGQKFHIAYEKAMSDQQAIRIEEYYSPYKRWFENYLYPSPDGLSIYFHDITDRKLAEQAVVESELRLRNLIDGLGPAILVGMTTPDGILLEANQPALAAAGLKLADVIGKPLEDTFWVNYSETSKNQIRGAVTRGAQGESSRFDMQIRGVADQPIMIDFSMQSVRDETGQVKFLVPSASVITERKLAEIALHESEERYRLLVDQSPYAIGVIQEGKIVLANRAALFMFGADQATDFIGHSIVDHIHPEQVDAATQRIGRMLLGELGLYPAEDRYMKLDGTVFDVEVSAVPFTYKNHRALQVIAVDISKRKQAEALLHANRLQLKAISRRTLEVQEAERRRVAIELHDELGQALTAIKLNLQSRDRLPGQSIAELNNENLRIVEEALQQVRRMALTLRPSLLDDLGLTAALRWLVDQAADHHGLIPSFLPVMPQKRVASDIETAYFRIAQTAITNIVRHSQAKHVTLELFQHGETLVMRLHDDGIGFDLAAMRERAKAGGSIGLLGMEERALLIGGVLDIESKPGEGTTLQVSCPLRRAGESL